MTWQTKTLGEVCDIYQPKTISAKDMTSDGKYVVFGANGVIGRYDKYNHEEPQLLITCRGATCGSVNISTPKSWITGNAMVVRPKNNSLELKYLEYIFRGGIDVSKVITGTAQPQITRTNLEPVEISYPESLTEQRRIIKLLDEVFEKATKAKEAAEKNLRNSKELFESYLQSVFANPGKDWDIKKLGELTELITKGTTPTTLGFKFVNEGVNFIKIESITADGKFIPNKFAAITSECHEALKRSQLKEGDILFSIAGALGRTVFVTEDVLPANTNQALAIVRLKPAKEVMPEFVLTSLHSGLTGSQISSFKGGVAQQNLSLEQLKNFVIKLPPLTEQKAIVKKLDALLMETKKLEKIYSQKLADLEELKKSVLQQAFTGKL